jgi:hypothetical protein
MSTSLSTTAASKKLFGLDHPTVRDMYQCLHSYSPGKRAQTLMVELFSKHADPPVITLGGLEDLLNRFDCYDSKLEARRAVLESILQARRLSPSVSGDALTCLYPNEYQTEYITRIFDKFKRPMRAAPPTATLAPSVPDPLASVPSAQADQPPTPPTVILIESSIDPQTQSNDAAPAEVHDLPMLKRRKIQKATQPAPPTPPPQVETLPHNPLFSCQSCDKYFEWIVTPCGHGFCANCLVGVLSAKKRCTKCNGPVDIVTQFKR